MGKESDLVGKCCGKGESGGDKGKSGGDKGATQDSKKGLKKKCTDSGKKRGSSTKKGKEEKEKECHSSHEQFKQKQTDRDKFESAEGKGEAEVKFESAEGKGEAEVKCHSSKAAFFKKSSDQTRSDKGDTEKCEDSYRSSGQTDDERPSTSKLNDCPPSRGKDDSRTITESTSAKKGDLCDSSKKSAFQSSSRSEAMPMRKSRSCTSSSVSVDPCSSKKKAVSSMKGTNLKDNNDGCTKSATSTGICSKISNYCKNLAKEYVKPKNKAKCCPDEDFVKQDKLCGQKPPTQPVCPPYNEEGADLESSKKSLCVSKATCPQLKKPKGSDFFPLDARNKQLNDCIEKYMKIDPGQVISKCSRFANKTFETSEKCPVSAQCGQSVKTSSAMRKSSGLMSQMFSPRNLQLMSRWAPSAGIYLATTAALTVYICEWRAVLDYVPFYKDQNGGSTP